ncbi:hypothetical protein E0Z10_g6383 [Xylaria hypoxylon]|uniref:Uncharacterized protein n=1 Tax=Xylaria hypoxylon TaxID=37992 RepID=A0A4Z0YED7_9PEZI|nr:hypothetical protein E0Z10_g6383 [Xylaria hypoxylon]
MDAAGARHVGARLLGEVEEGNLEEAILAMLHDESGDDDDVVYSLRGAFTNNSSRYRNLHIPIPMADLSATISRYHRATQSAPPPLMSVSGRYLAFLYHFLSTLISSPHNYTVVVVDVEGKFDVTRLIHPTPATSTTNPSNAATPADLAHVHVYQPGHEQLHAALAGVDEYMLYGSHSSRGRQWWGTVVVGGVGGDVNAGWKGWLRVEREGVTGFAVGMSVEEALREREKRHEVVERAGWMASSLWGTHTWKGG